MKIFIPKSQVQRIKKMASKTEKIIFSIRNGCMHLISDTEEVLKIVSLPSEELSGVTEAGITTDTFSLISEEGILDVEIDQGLFTLSFFKDNKKIWSITSVVNKILENELRDYLFFISCRSTATLTSSVIKDVKKLELMSSITGDIVQSVPGMVFTDGKLNKVFYRTNENENISLTQQAIKEMCSYDGEKTMSIIKNYLFIFKENYIVGIRKAVSNDQVRIPDVYTNTEAPLEMLIDIDDLINLSKSLYKRKADFSNVKINLETGETFVEVNNKKYNIFSHLAIKRNTADIKYVSLNMEALSGLAPLQKLGKAIVTLSCFSRVAMLTFPQGINVLTRCEGGI